MKKIALLMAVGTLFVSGMSTQVSAVSVSAKPTRPTIAAISSKASSRTGRVDMTISFQLSTTHRKSPLQQTDVKAGLYTCRALKTSSKCTIRNVPVGKAVRVAVRAKNRNGYSSWSTTVSFVPKVGAKWVRQVPVSFQPINPVIPTVATTTPPVGVSTTALQFDFSGAVGLVLQDASTVTASAASVSKSAANRSNLLGMTRTGEVFDAVKSGAIKVKEFLIAPNDTLYLHSESTRVNGKDCVLLAVSITSGAPDCVETDTSYLFQDSYLDFNGTPLPGSFFEKFQFDDLGGIAYIGIPTSDRVPGFGWGGTSATEVRHYRAGKKFVVRPTNPFPSSIRAEFKTPLKNFLLLKDGSLLIEEVKYPSEDYPANCYVCQIEFQLVHYHTDGRRVVVAGFPNAFARTEAMTFINRFPDGRIIIGTQYGWLEVDPARDEVKSRPYYSWSSTLTTNWTTAIWQPYGNLLGQTPSFAAESFNCPVLDNLYSAMYSTDSSGLGYVDDRFQSGARPDHIYLREICYDLARHWRKAWFANNRLIVFSSRHFNTSRVGENRNGDLLDIEYQGLLVQAYPAFKPIVTSITSVNVAQPVLNSVLLSGTDSSGASKTVLYDLDTNTETPLITGLQDLRIRSLTVNTGDNAVYFGARRVADNKSVIGKVNVSTREVTILKEMPADLLNIQLLNTAGN